MSDKLFYEKHIFCCINERDCDHPRGCCMRRGAKGLQAHMKKRLKSAGLLGRMRVNKSGCLNRCELGPCIVIYPEGVWYHAETDADIDAIVDQHILGGQVVKRLMITPGQDTELRKEQITVLSKGDMAAE